MAALISAHFVFEIQMFFQVDMTGNQSWRDGCSVFAPEARAGWAEAVPWRVVESSALWIVIQSMFYVSTELEGKPLSESRDAVGLTGESNPWVTQMSVYEDWFVDKWQCDFTSITELFFLQNCSHLHVIPNLWTDKTDFLLWSTKVDTLHILIFFFFVRTIKVDPIPHWQKPTHFSKYIVFLFHKRTQGEVFLYPCAVLNIIHSVCCSLSKWPAF